MLLKNFVKLINESQSLIITDISKLEPVFVFDFSEKCLENNFWIGSYGKAYKDSEVIDCYAKDKDILVVVVKCKDVKEEK